MKKIRTYKIYLILSLMLVSMSAFSAVKESWWPEQKLPAQIVRIRPANLKERNLVQSISGLAAKGVNNGTNNELIWTNVTGTAYNYFLSKWLQRTGVVDRGETDLWSLVAQYKNKNIIKGYVLYKEGAGNYSVNFATLYASRYDAILVEESMEAIAISYGLTLKFDARPLNSLSSYTAEWFNTVKSWLNKTMIVTLPPDDYKQRDMAIAHGCMVYWGTDDFYKSVLSWMDPNSPVVGWNAGDEGTHVEIATRYGMLTTGASIVNLPILSAGANAVTPDKVRNVNPKLLDFSTGKDYHAFVMSDGDNMMIQATSLPLNVEYWANPDINNLPMNWTSCPVNLSQMVPDAWKYYVEQSSETPGNIIEFGGAYQYPDLYASSRGSEASTIHRQFAGMVNKKMKSTGSRVFGFITRNSLSSDAAKAAYQIYADSIENLVGIIAVQYVPYNGGSGSVFWVTNKHGVHIPVFTAKYQMWAGLNVSNSGNPATIANLLNNSASQTSATLLDWTIVHAWSYFKKDANGIISDAVAADEGAVRGVSPAVWSKDLLNNNFEIVSIEELLWRLRMKYYPDETLNVINNYIPAEEEPVSYPDSLGINFANFTTSSTEMMLAQGYNNWLSASGYQWESQYCYAQDITTLPYIGKAIRFGASALSNTGKATTPKLDLRPSEQQDVVLQLSVGCGSTKGGMLEVKIDNFVIDTISASKDGDSGANGTSFGARMYDFEYIIPASVVSSQSTITLTHSRSVSGEYIYMNKFRVFRRMKLTSVHTNQKQSLIITENRNGYINIQGLSGKATIEAFTMEGKLIKKIVAKDNSGFYLNGVDCGLVLIKVIQSNGISIHKVFLKK